MQGLLFHRTGTDTEDRIERAEGDQAGQNEDAGHHEGNNAPGARHRIRGVQYNKKCGYDDADDAVGVAHILFHDL